MTAFRRIPIITTIIMVILADKRLLKFMAQIYMFLWNTIRSFSLANGAENDALGAVLKQLSLH